MVGQNLFSKDWTNQIKIKSLVGCDHQQTNNGFHYDEFDNRFKVKKG